MAPPPPPPPPAGPPSFKVESAGGSSLKVGILAQAQYEALGHPVQDSYAHNLFMRRTRLIVGGSLWKNFDYFFETDFANLFKSADGANAMMVPVSTKATPGMTIQDIMITWRPLAFDKALGDMLKIDVGYMLPPLSHNAVQSAASLLAFDYFNYTFVHSNAFGASAPFAGVTGPVGRDAGFQLRGLLVDGHVEYRVGLFQGLRVGPLVDPATMAATDVGGRNFFRAIARVQINLLDPEPGFFYAGTYLGTKKILSVGGSFDIQRSYKYWAADAIADLPLGPGVLSAQVNVAQWNASNNTTFIALAKQTAIMAEAGFIIGDLKLAPVGRFEHRSVATPTAALPNENRFGGGLALFAFGHNSNLKVFFIRVSPDFMGLHDYNQFVAQWQLFVY